MSKRERETLLGDQEDSLTDQRERKRRRQEAANAKISEEKTRSRAAKKERWDEALRKWREHAFVNANGTGAQFRERRSTCTPSISICTYFPDATVNARQVARQSSPLATFRKLFPESLLEAIAQETTDRIIRLVNNGACISPRNLRNHPVEASEVETFFIMRIQMAIQDVRNKREWLSKV